MSNFNLNEFCEYCNNRLGFKVYRVNNGRIEANKLSKKDIKRLFLDDLISNGKLTNRAQSYLIELKEEYLK